MINDSDRAFRDSIERCEWSGPFSHEDHVRLAWIYLQEHQTGEAISRCGTTLRNLAESHGDFDKYHETLTVAMIELIASHLPARMSVSHLHWGGGTPTALELNHPWRICTGKKQATCLFGKASRRMQSS